MMEVLTNNSKVTRDELCQFYHLAKKRVIEAGFAAEGAWQLSLEYRDFTESDLLRETAWVILCSGFKEKIVRKAFDYISLCFCDWVSAAEIIERREICTETARAKINNARKINAIIEVAQIISKSGFHNIKSRILDDPLNELQSFPFIGTTTSYHLAKNLGFPIAKPDRHLVRLAARTGYSDVQTLCQTLSDSTGDPIQYVDLIFWRFSTLTIND